MTTKAKATKPTAKKNVASKKKTLAIVGFARTTRDLAPWKDKSIEIWGINEGYNNKWMKRWDRWFQMHPRWNFTRTEANLNDPKHWEWLRKEHDFPIYMQEKYDDVPASVRFPLEECIKAIGRRYFTSSVAMMMVFAVLEGFKRIELYGIEMASDTEYKYQRPGGEFAIGWCLGKGIEIYTPPECTLMRAPLYGYEEVQTGYRQYIEFRSQYHVDVHRNLVDAMKFQQGQLTEIKNLQLRINGGKKVPTIPSLKKAYDTLHKKVGRDLENTIAKLNSVTGSKTELGHLMEKYDEFGWGGGAGGAIYEWTAEQKAYKEAAAKEAAKLRA